MTTVPSLLEDGVLERAVAVVGMAGRFPGAPDLATLWQNLMGGVESVRRFSRAELEAAGVDAESLDDPRYVPAKAVLDDADLFDAAAFGFARREAEVLDPQHRLFLECALEALEDGAVDPERFPGLIAVYAGAGASSYAMHVLLRNPRLLRTLGTFQLTLSNDKDYLPTLTSYKLGLRGPSFAVQSACSTSLVAIHLATQSLIGYECDLALAGGSSIGFPQVGGYRYQEGGILSPDGHCRPFDAAARGTAPGSGVGVVLLKRLADARADGDDVYAVIRGSAVNNDGARRIGFTAPSVAGQAEVIAAAQAMAGVPASAVSYVEAHGTGTPLGDPIEVAALARVFANADPASPVAEGDAPNLCHLGSIKSNFGHVDTAAGVAGFLKTVLALRHRQLPPSLHFEHPNPQIDFAATPFRVVSQAQPWETAQLPRRAGVSSFGIGGTNAHVVLEEAPPPPPSSPALAAQLVLLSARTPSALAAAGARLGSRLAADPTLELADVTATLALGRRQHGRRAAFVTASRSEAAALATSLDPERVRFGSAEAGSRELVFLFPGQGAQRLGMLRGAAAAEPAVAATLARCAELLGPELGFELRTVLDPPAGSETRAAELLATTRLTQLALFVVELALAELWQARGATPAAFLGHSIGELVAAHLGGLFSLDDALQLVAARGRAMDALPPGAMLAVSLSEAAIAEHLSAEPWGADLDLAAVNAPDLVTVSGAPEPIAALEAQLGARGVRMRRLHTRHAFHSRHCEAVLPAWSEALERVRFGPVERPWLSNLSGDWVDPVAVATPAYWLEHLRRPVRFGAAVARLLEGRPKAFLEVGPGRSLTSLVLRQPAAAGVPVVASLPAAEGGGDEQRNLLEAWGSLWVAGTALDPAPLFEGRRRVHLPTYPFERERFWVDPPESAARRPTETARPAPAPLEPGVAASPTSGPRTLPTPFVEPRGDAERAITAAFEALLGVSPVGAHDDFFEAGGSSLAAVSLLAEIEARTGVALEIGALARGATVAALARALAAERSASVLVDLGGMPGAATPGAATWVLVHPIGGTLLGYLELARRLGARGRVLGLRAPGLEPGEAALGSVEALAEHHLGSLGEVAGPLWLVGWSFGGLVAAELARRLAPARLAGLALLDAALPDATRPLPPAGDPRLLAWFWRDLAGIGGRPTASPTGLDGLDEGTRRERLAVLAEEAGLVRGRGGRERLLRLLHVFETHAGALARYRPANLELAAPVWLARAEEGPDGAAEPEVGWRALLGRDPELVRLPGNHYTLLQNPLVSTLAERLLAFAAEATPANPTTLAAAAVG